jgi:hypothetical protein
LVLQVRHGLFFLDWISPIEIVLQEDLLLFCVFSLGQNDPTTRLQWNKSKLFKCSVTAKVTSAHGDASNVEQILKAIPTLIYMCTAIRTFAWNKKNSNLQSTWWLAWIAVPLSATSQQQQNLLKKRHWEERQCWCVIVDTGNPVLLTCLRFNGKKSGYSFNIFYRHPLQCEQQFYWVRIQQLVIVWFGENNLF